MSALTRALTLAAEYRRLNDSGDVVLASQARMTIEDLVGRPVGGGTVELPHAVRAIMWPRGVQS